MSRVALSDLPPRLPRAPRRLSSSTATRVAQLAPALSWPPAKRAAFFAVQQSGCLRRLRPPNSRSALLTCPVRAVPPPHSLLFLHSFPFLPGHQGPKAANPSISNARPNRLLLSPSHSSPSPTPCSNSSSPLSHPYFSIFYSPCFFFPVSSLGTAFPYPTPCPLLCFGGITLGSAQAGKKGNNGRVVCFSRAIVVVGVFAPTTQGLDLVYDVIAAALPSDLH